LNILFRLHQKFHRKLHRPFFQQLSNFKAEINKSKVASKHWKRERCNLKFEDVPGVAPEDLELTDLVKQ
jgi:hypothetical protein